MPQFVITYPSGLIDREIVDDVDSVEGFVNRKFGSVDPKEHGIKVEMEPEFVAMVEDDEEEDDD